jgi:hypothetical protein
VKKIDWYYIFPWLIAGFLLFGEWHNTGHVNELRQENAALKAQIAEWQKATAPAITARDWWTTGGALRTQADLKPEHLERALNPCYTTPSGAFEGSTQCSTYDRDGGGRLFVKPVAIQILRADR